jgi:3-methylcrotonyl-CoA carboxylase beta subunit
MNAIEFDPTRDEPKYGAEDLYGLLNPEPGSSNVYDMREVIARIVDRSEFDEYKAEFGRTVICGYARIGGRAVGIVANQKTNQSQTVATGPAAGMHRMKLAGSSIPKAHRRQRASLWTAIRTSCRSYSCTT